MKPTTHLELLMAAVADLRRLKKELKTIEQRMQVVQVQQGDRLLQIIAVHRTAAGLSVIVN